MHPLSYLLGAEFGLCLEKQKSHKEIVKKLKENLYAQATEDLAESQSCGNAGLVDQLLLPIGHCRKLMLH